MHDVLFHDFKKGKHPAYTPPKPKYRGTFLYQSTIGSCERIYFIQTSVVVIKSENQCSENSDNKTDENKPIILRRGLAFRVCWMWNGRDWQIQCESLYNEPCIKTRKMILFKV
jgi:hypothetical protein